MKKVTIITVVYNASDLILKTILSVKSQTYKNIEYIVIDGGSTDGTLDVIRKNKSSIDIVVSEKDSGIYDAMNKGILSSTGDYINFLNAGDWHEENFIEEVFFKKYKSDVKYYHSNMKLIRNDNLIGLAKPVTDKRFKKHMANPLLHPTLIVSSSLFSELGLFDIHYKIASDHDWVYKMIEKYSGIYTDTALTNFLVGGISSGSQALRESKQILEKNGMNAVMLNMLYIKNLIKNKLSNIN